MSNSQPKTTETAAVLATLKPALCPPKRRLEGIMTEDFVRMILWHEKQAERAMNALHCGSENWEHKEADQIANAHWAAAALMRLHIGART